MFKRNIRHPLFFLKSSQTLLCSATATNTSSSSSSSSSNADKYDAGWGTLNDPSTDLALRGGGGSPINPAFSSDMAEAIEQHRRESAMRTGLGRGGDFWTPAGSNRGADVEAVLQAVRDTPGETAAFYAARYFAGQCGAVQIQSVLWNSLKKFGHVDVDRGESRDNEPRWFPAANLPRRGPQVSRYNPDDNDLTLLEEVEEFGAMKVEKILSGEETEREQDEQLSGGAAAFSSSSAGFAAQVDAAAERKYLRPTEPPQEVGWGTSSAGRSAAAWGSRSRGFQAAEQRWKKDIVSMQRSASGASSGGFDGGIASAAAPRPPPLPWKGGARR